MLMVDLFGRKFYDQLLQDGYLRYLAPMVAAFPFVLCAIPLWAMFAFSRSVGGFAGGALGFGGSVFNFGTEACWLAQFLVEGVTSPLKALHNWADPQPTYSVFSMLLSMLRFVFPFVIMAASAFGAAALLTQNSQASQSPTLETRRRPGDGDRRHCQYPEQGH